MPISIQDVYDSFIGSFRLEVKLLKEFCNVRNVEFQPKEGTGLFIPPRVGEGLSNEARACVVPLDYAIAPSAIATHSWDYFEIEFARRVIPPSLSGFTLIDIGANVGLFSRQMLAAFEQIQDVFLYEPDPENFAYLTRNLQAFPNLKKNNYGLGLRDEKLEFYRDRTNSGNYSLNKSAMPQDDSFDKTTIEVKGAKAACKKWAASGLPIFYKSDTQGHDEAIATSTDPKIWKSVFAGIFELWRIEKPEFSLETFRAILDQFPNKVFLQEPARMLTTDEVIVYIQGRDGHYRDLGFWK
ncbi:FkbM family methyltransferase [Methyloferula stellata]|uniref:FkbM family methyltransferase n=1 Tax=Methyloferula stellata TaxID=876270 RepID=UPI000376D2B4|nr:FkbM family methyltransferase [Methyloferula stellata]